MCCAKGERSKCARRSSLPANLAVVLAFLLLRTPQTFLVQFETSKGNFTVEVHRDWAPHGADRLYELAREHFFDNQRFFRVRAGYIAQFGLHADPGVIAQWKTKTIPDDPVRQTNAHGT